MAGLLLAVLGLSGCGSEWQEEKTGGQTEELAEHQDSEKTVLTIYAWQDEEVNIGKLSEAFEEKYPEITVELNFIPITEYTQQMMMIKDGIKDADCIFFSTPAEAAIWMNKGLLKNLCGRYSSEELEEQYGIWYPQDNEACREYMLPYRMSRWAVYYNQDLFDKRGISYPEDDWTWEEYAQTAKALTRQVGGDRSWGSLSFEPTNIWWRIPARTAGYNDPMDEDTLAAFKKAAKWCFDLTYEMGAQPPYNARTGQSGSNYDARFLSGDIGMYFSGDWSVAVLNRMIEEQSLDFRYDIAPMPHWAGERSSVISDAAVACVVEGTEDEDAAFAFLSFAAGEEGARILASGGVIPALCSEEILSVFLQENDSPEHKEAFFQEGPISRVPADGRYNEAMEIIKKEVSLYLLKEQDLDKTFQNIEQEINSMKQE